MRDNQVETKNFLRFRKTSYWPRKWNSFFAQAYVFLHQKPRRTKWGASPSALIRFTRSSPYARKTPTCNLCFCHRLFRYKGQ